MSDEYRNNGANGSLVNDSLADSGIPPNARDAATGNYPPPGDSTSSGGYGSPIDSFSPAAQRGAIQQSTNGTDLTSEIQDAKQGVDEDTRRDVTADKLRNGLSPYTGDSLESKEEAREALADRFSPRK